MSEEISDYETLVKLCDDAARFKSVINDTKEYEHLTTLLKTTKAGVTGSQNLVSKLSEEGDLPLAELASCVSELDTTH